MENSHCLKGDKSIITLTMADHDCIRVHFFFLWLATVVTTDAIYCSNFIGRSDLVNWSRGVAVSNKAIKEGGV